MEIVRFDFRVPYRQYPEARGERFSGAKEDYTFDSGRIEMKFSVRVFAISIVAATAGVFSFVASRALAFYPPPSDFTLNQEAVQILKGSLMCFSVQPNTSVGGLDTLNLKITFTNNGDGMCDAADSDIIGQGISLSVAPGTCVQNNPLAFSYTIPSFVPKTVGGVKIGTYFAVNGPGSVTAKATTQTTSACGKWILELQATKLNLSAITQNPIALRLADKDGDTTCFDINNALIGTGF